MKFVFGFLISFLLIDYSQQICAGCPCGECPLASACTVYYPDIFSSYVYCDNLCMTCAKNIRYPCIYCETGTFCYIEQPPFSSANIWCLGCDSYPNFCAGPYNYGSYPYSKDKPIIIASNSSTNKMLFKKRD